MTAPELIDEASRRGLRLEPRGNKLAVIPSGRLTAAFADLLRQHKRELLDLLETKTVALRPDEVPWLYVSRQILGGEFVGCDNSTRESLSIGLGGIRHPLCQQALIRLKSQQEKPA